MCPGLVQAGHKTPVTEHFPEYLGHIVGNISVIFLEHWCAVRAPKEIGRARPIFFQTIAFISIFVEQTKFFLIFRRFFKMFQKISDSLGYVRLKYCTIPLKIRTYSGPLSNAYVTCVKLPA